jgi:hypothetical protein
MTINNNGGLTTLASNLFNLGLSTPGQYLAMGANSPQSGSLVTVPITTVTGSVSTPPPSQGVNENGCLRAGDQIPAASVTLISNISNMSIGRI